MFNWIKRKIHMKKAINSSPIRSDKNISVDLEQNVKYIKDYFRGSSDIVLKPFRISKEHNMKAAIVAVDGLFDKTAVNENIIKPLMTMEQKENNKKEIYIDIKNHLYVTSNIKEETSMDRSIKQMMQGEVILFIDGISTAFIFDARTWEMRGIQEPVTETVIRGPREGFVETLRINTSMLRRKIHHPMLKISNTFVGAYSQTEVAIAYIEGIVNPKIVEEVKERIDKINIDAILESGYIEELIEDAPLSPFPTIANTERPDVVAGRLLEGRVAIFTDGTPVALIVPHLFLESFQNVEDYYSRPYYASIVRLLRIFALFLTTLFPALYLSSERFHKEIIPIDLLITIAAAREHVPFPLFFEVSIMTLGFEFLREAGVRMPKPIGQAVSIVGALVLGEAAVNAGFTSATTVIVVAVAGITSLLSPPIIGVNFILRMTFLIAAAFFGFYGIMLVLIITILHLASLRSFGIPYMSPWFPTSWRGWKDLFIRFPIWALNRRPKLMVPDNVVRQGDNQMPRPPKEKKGEGNQ